MRYIGPLQLASPDAYRLQILQRFIPYYARHPGYGFFAAQECAGGDFIGWFHLRPALDCRFVPEAGHRGRELGVGFRLGRTWAGQGFATEGSRHLVRRAFADPRTRRVVACALVGNAASTRVMEKVGLEWDGQFAVPGYDMPAVRHVLTRQRFEVSPFA